MISLFQHLEAHSEQRRIRILAGAMKVFLAYGFQRTTMNDIARAAEVSRPALYLLFRNKTDIYRALASEFLEEAATQIRAILEQDDVSLPDRLHQAISTVMKWLDEIEDAPHGVELLDMQNSLAGDIIASGRIQTVTTFTEAIARDLAASGRELGPGLTAAGLANLLLDAVDGLKARHPDRPQQQRLQNEYVRAVVALLER